MDSELIEEKIKGETIKFKTRPGVFSRQRLDLGSKLLIDKMEIEDGTLIADLGCGSGIIGFAAAKQNREGHVHLLDVNLRFVELAKENAQLNRLWNVEVFLSDNFSAVPGRTYHQILSNPAQHVGNEYLEDLAKECFKHLKPGGQVMWVVQKQMKEFIERLFQSTFKNAKIVAHGKDHAVVAANKTS